MLGRCGYDIDRNGDPTPILRIGSIAKDVEKPAREVLRLVVAERRRDVRRLPPTLPYRTLLVAQTCELLPRVGNTGPHTAMWSVGYGPGL